MSKNCPECKSENKDVAKFCKGCGFYLHTVSVIPKSVAPESQACGNCGSKNSIGAKFCKSCGAPVAKISAVAVSPPALAPPATPEPSPSALVLPRALGSPSTYVPKPVFVSAPPLMADTVPVVETTLKNKVESQRKKMLSSRFLVCLAMACVGLAGGGYWLVTSNGKSNAAVTPAIATATAVISTPKPAAAAAVAAQVPAPVAAASSIEPIPALISPVVQQPGAPKPMQELAPAPEPAVTPANKSTEPPSVTRNKSANEVRPASKLDQRMADQAAMEQKASRQAIARQRERDKAKLSNANRTLDDLLK